MSTLAFLSRYEWPFKLLGDYAARRIARAKIQTYPFPHLVVDDVLPRFMVRHMRSAWPSRESMEPEALGTMDRYWKHLNVHGADHTVDMEPFWQRFANQTMKAVHDALTKRFDGYVVTNDYRPASLVCFESGPGFVEHGRHTHYNHNPNWTLTLMIQVDDGDREDRGTRLYGLREFDPRDDNNYLTAVKSDTGSQKTFTAKDIAFKPGRLWAFVDGPISIHGSTPFPNRVAVSKRKVIRAHLEMPHELGVERYGEAPLDAVNAAQTLADLDKYPGFADDRKRAALNYVTWNG